MSATPTPARRGRGRRLRWMEPWYSAYGLDGLVVLGVGPILIPLSVEQAGAGTVGLVIAAFYVGALFTTVAGSFADRTGRQREVFLACFPVMAVTMVGFAYAEAAWQWAPLAAVFGGAGAIAGTVGAMFVVEAHPKDEWNSRISWFRLAYGAGQVVGLVLAAATTKRLELGWWIAAVAILCALPLGRIGLPRLGPGGVADRGELEVHPTTSARQVNAVGWILHAYHRLDLTRLKGEIRSRYGLLLFAWLITMIGVQTFFNVVPLVMSDGFRVDASVSSLTFMVGAGIGTLLFPALGALATRIGAGRVLGLGLAITLVSFSSMAVAEWTDPSWKGSVAIVALVAAAVAYSFEVSAATMLFARLSPSSEGAAMGAFNSAIAAGAIIGALVPSAIAARFGYGSLPLIAAGVVFVALLLSLPLVLPGDPDESVPTTATVPS